MPRRLAAHGPRGRGGAARGAEALHVTLDLDGPPGRAPARDRLRARARAGACASTGCRVRSLAAWRARAVLVFLPDELRAVKGPPAARRRALDRVLEAAVAGLRRGPGRLPGARWPSATRCCGGSARAPASEASLPAWEAPMAALGARVAAARRAGVAALAGPFAALARGAGRRRRRAGWRLETVAAAR